MYKAYIKHGIFVVQKGDPGVFRLHVMKEIMEIISLLRKKNGLFISRYMQTNFVQRLVLDYLSEL